MLRDKPGEAARLLYEDFLTRDPAGAMRFAAEWEESLPPGEAMPEAVLSALRPILRRYHVIAALTRAQQAEGGAA